MRQWARIAHRGASAEMPENSLSAFRRAVEIGVDGVEMDVHLSRDGRVIVMHDAKLDRTTNGEGLIREKTLAELRDLTIQPTGEAIPTLEDALEAIPLDVLAIVEIKAAEATEPTARIVQQMNRLDQVVVISFDPSALATLRRLDSRIPTALLIRRELVKDNPIANGVAMLRAAQEVGTSTLDLNASLVTPESSWEIRRRGGNIWTWTVNEIDRMRALLELGVTGITSDYPDRLNEIQTDVS